MTGWTMGSHCESGMALHRPISPLSVTVSPEQEDDPREAARAFLGSSVPAMHSYLLSFPSKFRSIC